MNVGEDIFLIETDVTKNGAMILKQQIEYRDRLTRAKRWKQMDEDLIDVYKRQSGDLCSGIPAADGGP